MKVVALLTRMDEPLGVMIGNALEVREAIDILRSEANKDVMEITFVLGSEMLRLAGIPDADKQLQSALSSGAALKKFCAMVEAQGGDPRITEDPRLLPTARQRTPIYAGSAGILHSIDALIIGQCALHLGAGRQRMEDPIDPSVGIELACKAGDRIERDQVLAFVHYNRPAENIIDRVGRAFYIRSDAPLLEQSRLVIEKI